MMSAHLRGKKVSDISGDLSSDPHRLQSTGRCLYGMTAAEPEAAAVSGGEGPDSGQASSCKGAPKLGKDRHSANKAEAARLVREARQDHSLCRTLVPKNEGQRYY